MNHKILVVEDEKAIRELLISYLSDSGYETLSTEDGLSALKCFHDYKPDLVILDRMLPGISGDQVCQEIRRISNIPILMLTAKSSEESKIEGFEIGVDDYVTKPFSTREVMVRVRALLKRTYPESQKNTYSDDTLSIHFDTKTILLAGQEIRVTANEFHIIEVLFMNKPKPLTRAQIVEGAFGYEYEAYERNMDTYIKNIRHKIELDPKNPVYIMTKYGIGYYFGG